MSDEGARGGKKGRGLGRVDWSGREEEEGKVMIEQQNKANGKEGERRRISKDGVNRRDEKENEWNRREELPGQGRKGKTGSGRDGWNRRRGHGREGK